MMVDVRAASRRKHMTRTSHLTAEEETIFQDVASILREVITDYCLDISLSPDTTIQSDLDLESFDVVRFGLALSRRYGEGVNLANYLSELDFELILKLTLGDISRYVAQQVLLRKDLPCE
jgi:acyl carrier protein